LKGRTFTKKKVITEEEKEVNKFFAVLQETPSTGLVGEHRGDAGKKRLSPKVEGKKKGTFRQIKPRSKTLRTERGDGSGLSVLLEIKVRS